MNLTPFSAYIITRSTFIKNYLPEQQFLNLCLKLLTNSKKNQQLTNIVKILEEKESKAEASALKSFEEKSQDIFCLKKALTPKDSELACLQKEIKLVNKT